MDKEKREFYRNKFNKLMKNPVILDPDRTMEIITLDTLETIIKNEDIYEKFLDFEDNLDFFSARRDSLVDYVSGINAYVTYMFENGSEFSNEELERIQIITGKEPVIYNQQEGKRRKELSETAVHILGDSLEIEKLITNSDSEMINGFRISELKKYIFDSEGLKLLIENHYLDSEIERNYSFFKSIKELENDYYRVSKNIVVDKELEQEVESQINKRFDNRANYKDIDYEYMARRIGLVLRGIIIKSPKKDVLASQWEELVAYFLEKHGIKAYIKKDDENKDVKFIAKKEVCGIPKPIDIDDKARMEQYEGIVSTLKSTHYRLLPESKVSTELEKAVMSLVEYTDDKVVYAFNIYEALNKKLTFSSTMFALNQDMYNPVIRNLYEKDIGAFDEENNSVSCKNWAEIYAYFIEKHVGGEAYINRAGKHKKVTAAIDGVIVTADATNVTMSETETHDFTDLTRAKLGLKPSGFTTNFFVPSLDQKLQEYTPIDEDKVNSDFEEYEEKSDVNDLMNLLEDKILVDDILNLPSDENIGNILRKLKFISDIAKSEELPNTDNTKYLRILKNIVLDNNEKSRVKLTSSLYTNLDENQNCDLVPVFSINIADSKADIPKYLYLLYDSKKGLCRITKTGIMDLVASKSLNVIDNTVTDINRIIPGMLELYSEDEMNEYKMQMFNRSVTNRRLELKEDTPPNLDDQGDEER